MCLLFFVETAVTTGVQFCLGWWGKWPQYTLVIWKVTGYTRKLDGVIPGMPVGLVWSVVPHKSSTLHTEILVTTSMPGGVSFHKFSAWIESD